MGVSSIGGKRAFVWVELKCDSGKWRAGVRVPRGHPHPALRAPYPFCPFGTFPPDRGNRPFPLEGEGLRAAKGRPYGGKQTGSVGSVNSGADPEPHQEQILQTQGPVARREFRHALRFCAPEMFCPPQGITPVNGVRGKATMSTKCSSGAVPGDPLVSFPSLGKKLAPQGEIPLRTTNAVRNLPPHPAPSGPPFPIPSVASRHLPLTRGVGPQGEGLKRGGEIPPKKNTPISL